MLSVVTMAQDFNQALQLSPNFAMAYNNRGVAYMLADNIKKANADFSKATELGYSD